MRTYAVYSIGVGIVWAVILVMVSLHSPASKRDKIFLIFGGVRHWMGVRDDRSLLYPPPKKYRQDTGKAS